MEEKLNHGYHLYIERNLEAEGFNGLYVRQANGASTKVQTKENELDFIRILPTVEEYINEGYVFVLGKIENKFYAYLTDDINNIDRKYETYNQFFLNALVDVEEKVKSYDKSKKLGGGK